MERNRENSMIELFKQQGLNVEFCQDYMGRTGVKIHIGVFDVIPNIESVDKMIRSTVLNYTPLKNDLKLTQDQHKKMADYETFFRLLRGGE